MKRYAYGVDLGGTTIKIGLFYTSGEQVSRWEIPTRSKNHGKQLLPDIARAIQSNMQVYGLQPQMIEGIGLGVPGAVEDASYVAPCVNLDGWGNLNAAKELSKLCQLPTIVLNDANAAALGEMSHGGGKGYNNIVFVTLGTGVGGGIIIDGKLVAGTHGAGGEIGHIKVSESNDRTCGCGSSGCLEQYASATGLVYQAQKLLSSNDYTTILRDNPNLTSKFIFDCAKRGDVVACELVHDMTTMLGKALSTVSCVCDPEIFVIGGGVSRAGDIIIDGTRKAFRQYAFPAARDTRFALATLGNDAGMYGAMHMAVYGKK